MELLLPVWGSIHEKEREERKKKKDSKQRVLESLFLLFLLSISVFCVSQTDFPSIVGVCVFQRGKKKKKKKKDQSCESLKMILFPYSRD